MLITLVVLLTLASIFLRVSILSLDVAYEVAVRAGRIKRNTETLVVDNTVSSKKLSNTLKFGIKTSEFVSKSALNAVKSSAILAARGTLKVIRFIVSLVRNAIATLSVFVLMLDIVLFIVVITASAGFMSVYCEMDENGNLVFNQDVINSLNSGVSTETDVSNGLTETQIQDLILKECKNVSDFVRENNFTYGDAPINPAMNHDAKLVSCDRYVGWVLYNLGWKDQPRQHGLVVRSLSDTLDLTAFCKRNNFTRIDKLDNIKPGDIMFVGTPVRHTYIVGKYDQAQQMWARWDCGSDARITGSKASPSVEPIESDWVYAYRMDYEKLGLRSSKGTGSSSSGDSTIQTKHTDISEADLEWLARLCDAENGSSNYAVACEIAVALNLWETRAPQMEFKDYCIYGPPGIPAWFSGTSTGKASAGSGYNPNFLKIVKAAVYEGKRVYPKYIDEHDCLEDINRATNNGVPINVYNKSSYVKNQTIVYNRYTSVWYFYEFPDSASDPFGYTLTPGVENREKYGDGHYSWDKLKAELGLE